MDTLKTFKQALRDVLVPYIVGLRNEMRGVQETMKRIEVQEPPRDFRVHVDNPVESVDIRNFPEVQRVALADKTVAVDGLHDALKANATQVADAATKGNKAIAERIGSTAKQAHSDIGFVQKGIAELWKLLAGTLTVKVQNQVEFPKTQKVEVVNQKEVPSSILIRNSKPSEAIPVRLVDARGKKFYEALLSALTDVDLSKTNRLLQAIADKEFTFEGDIGDINMNTDEIEGLLTALNALVATEVTLLVTNSWLTSINASLDALNSTATVIQNNTTDATAELQDIEQELVSLNSIILAQLDVALSTRASEATLVQLFNEAVSNGMTTNDIYGVLNTQLDVLLSTRASEVTVASILTQLDVALSTRASEATVVSILAQLDVALSTRASEATLIQVRDHLDTVEAKLQSIMDNTDGVEGLLTSIRDYLDTAETKLQSIIDNTDTIETKLQTLIDGDLWQRSAVAGMAYITSTGNLAIATSAETPLLLFKNPNASGKTFRVKSFLICQDENQANKSTIIRFYRDPTITLNGVAVTPRNLKKSGGASVATAFTAPTISALGTLMRTTTLPSATLLLDEDLGYLIEQNENLLITVDTTANGFGVSAGIKYIEQ